MSNIMTYFKIVADNTTFNFIDDPKKWTFLTRFFNESCKIHKTILFWLSDNLYYCKKCNISAK